LLASAAIAGAGTAAAAECPNEAFRQGPSATLPECRAFEMVTPVDKDGGAGVYLYGEVHADPTGDAVAFASPSAYGNAEGNSLNNRYIGTRAGGAWGVNAIDGPQAIQENIMTRTTFAVSDNLEWALTASKEAIVPGAVPYGSNLYLRNARTGQTILVSARAGNAAFEEWATINAAPYVGASSDWSHVLLFSKQALAPGAVEGESNLYEFSEGELKLAAPAGAKPAVKSSEAYQPNVMSADGHRFFYTQGGVLYMHEDGAPAPIAVTASEKSGEEGVLKQGSFLGATPNGDIVFFSSRENLTGESEGEALYRYEADAPAGQRLTDLTPDSIIESGSSSAFGVAEGFSEDGTFVYFSSSAVLVPNAELPPITQGIVYAWHGRPGETGAVRMVAATEPGVGDTSHPYQYRVSADGRFLAMASASKLTPDVKTSPNCPAIVNSGVPAEHCVNVFAYSYDRDQLTCITCVETPLGNSEVGGLDSLIEVFNYVPRSVLNDGTVYLNTADALVPSDTNGITDVYGWKDGTPALLSTGVGDSRSLFGDASPDGTNVFLRTGLRLVGQDNDQALDVYDARVDGGLAGQAGTEATVACAGEESCRTDTTTTGAPASDPASSTLRGEGNVSTAKSCVAARGRVARARTRARSLRRRAKKASSAAQARKLRRRAHRQTTHVKQLKKKARKCEGGGR
jgi:hypothetical protein